MLHTHKIETFDLGNFIDKQPPSLLTRTVCKRGYYSTCCPLLLQYGNLSAVNATKTGQQGNMYVFDRNASTK